VHSHRRISYSWHSSLSVKTIVPQNQFIADHRM
jgi:hypothetical protein